MTLLHVYFHLRNQQAFQRLLERDRSGPFGSAGPSTSAGKSSPGKLWSRKSIASTPEVNAFDDLGRTVLHLVCSSTDASSTEYARMLLSHPNISVNLPDKENHWTALHRALYSGNIEAAILLLKHSDVDMSIKDFEGYTAFDLYNSTVRTTKPLSCDERILADLFTWGTNRNAALGLGDANDRILPDPVVLPMKDVTKTRSCSLEDRFATVRVCDVKMSKLHTAILTSERRDNLWVCGFGSGGRLPKGLGPPPIHVYTPAPITLPAECSIVSVALGQDHTLALTDAGEVLSWGLNRFSQLGYVVETGQGGCIQEPVQSTPRKISQLKKEFIKGIAACKSASACWSNSQVWTWGTNNGQLGYDKVATPVQVFPRQVSVITEPVYGMAMSETVTSCLFISGEVVCIWHGGMSKVNFPAHSFPSEISVYRPPRAIRGTVITKIASCEDSFVALSSNGEVFTFSAPTVSELDGLGLPGRREKLIKPQRVWALRRQAGSVRDVDIGGDGTFIVCTQSGHVYVCARSMRSSATSGNNRSFKFQRVPHIQRVIAVCANSTGSFGALQFVGRSFEADMTAIMPFVPEAGVVFGGAYTTGGNRIPANDEMEDAEILDDISSLERLMDTLRRLEGVPFDEGTATTASAHDADIVVCVDKNFAFPTHRLVLAARCRPLREILSGNEALKDKHVEMTINFLPFPTSPILGYLHMTGVNPLSDDLLALWDRRVGLVLAEQCKAVGILPMQIKYDLVTLAGLLELPQLAQALRSVVKCAPSSTACAQYRELFDHVQSATEPSGPDIRTDPLAPDVALYLRDKVVHTHSVVLRARCPFFSAFFGDKVWTSRRRNRFGVVDIRMDHFEWEVMRFVLGFICFGEEKLFDALDFLESADDVVEFMFRIVAAANELLLDRLLKGIENYMTVNLEMFLESRILDDLGALEVRHLAGYTRSEQAEKSPLVRSNRLARDAMEKHREWLANQDIPEPLVSSSKFPLVQKDPPGTSKTRSRPSLYPPPSLSLNPCLSSKLGSRNTAGDDLFIMDDMDVAPTLDSNVLRPSLPASPVRQYATLTPRPVWKTNPSTPRVDLKSIMVEAETKKIAPSPCHLRKTSEQFATRAPTTLTNSSGLQSKACPPKQPQPVPTTPTRLTNASSPSTLGPKIAPARQSHLSSGSPRPRKAQAAWTLYPAQSCGEPGVRDAVPSFAEIQLLQQTQGSFIKDKRSFLDIQEEERARQQEEGFLRWWATEEERVKQELAEQERLLSQAASNHTRGNRRDRKMRPTESELFSTPKSQGESCTSSAGSRAPKTRKPRPYKESNHER
ncbi:hypothetical protein F5141DRAFT_1146574 [Pisolithus sp. B1]|nr:hypothetical protein F5141DRAFT_1146574 [Pisolithus sp. B1]